MAGNVTHNLWVSLIATASSAAENTMREQAIAEIDSVTTTDINRAASVGVNISGSIPSTQPTLNTVNGGDVDAARLASQLTTFLQLYSRLRTVTFRQVYQSFGGGNKATRNPNYTKTVYVASTTSLSGVASPPAGFADTIANGDDIDLDAYRAVVNGLRTIISSQANTFWRNIDYCHSSCHNNCHSSRGRR